MIALVNDQSIRQVFRCIKSSQAKIDDCTNYVAEIARDTGLSRPTVTEAVQHLKDLGLVEIKRDGRRKVITVDASLLEQQTRSAG